MTHKELKDSIVEKFGTIKKFTDLAGLSYDSQKEFLNRNYETITEDEQARINDVMKLSEQLEVKPTSSELTDSDRDVLKQSIKSVYGSVKKLSEVNKDWSLSSLNDLTNGRRKRRSKRVIELAKSLAHEMKEKEQRGGLSDFEFNLSIQLQKIAQ